MSEQTKVQDKCQCGAAIALGTDGQWRHIKMVFDCPYTGPAEPSPEVAPMQEEECELCEGTGEVTLLDRRDTACSDCVAREKNAEIAILKAAMAVPAVAPREPELKDCQFDQMLWPFPDHELSHRMRYAPQNLTREDFMRAARELDAYAHLITLPQKRRNEICSEIQKGPNT